MFWTGDFVLGVKEWVKEWMLKSELKSIDVTKRVEVWVWFDRMFGLQFVFKKKNQLYLI